MGCASSRHSDAERRRARREEARQQRGRRYLSGRAPLHPDSTRRRRIPQDWAADSPALILDATLQFLDPPHPDGRHGFSSEPEPEPRADDAGHSASESQVTRTGAMFASAVRPTGVFFSGHLSQGTPVFDAEPPRRERAEERTCPEADSEQLRKMIKQAECEPLRLCSASQLSDGRGCNPQDSAAGCCSRR